ncbi:cation diffusion facilitator family transporter [Paenibacillus bovis]|uniref:Cation diffusion facilitator family transporter n=1 Tax=Paenibacillus bovis TaxID=1616788 RepID=A0A172ZCN3_9BACL|nr:cation diffusion facilitator family transporter [Paenibacillus bovis]ANF95378.1 cation diffusion facilitator family transporter [Paenibacillus bovis]
MSRTLNSSMLAAWASLVSNIILTLLKLIVGVLFNSQVLIADGIHNAGDVIASATALGSMRISSMPPDEDHPYGHGKAEVVGASVVAGILLIAALYIGYHSFMLLFEPPSQPHIIALIAAFISLVWKLVLYVYTMRIGRETNSKGLIATAQDHLADVYASAAACAGIGLGLIGEAYGWSLLSYGDPLAGMIVALLILKLAYETGRDSIDILMEKAVHPEKIEAYAAVLKNMPEVKRIDRIRAREHGQYIVVDVRIGVDATLTIQQGHDISRVMKKNIMTADTQVTEVLVHLNPWYAGEEPEHEVTVEFDSRKPL